MSEPDFYAVLGVNPDADATSIRTAYRRAAREHHPDRGGSAQQFHQIQAAWDTLGSSESRAEYDRRRRGTGSASSAGSPSTTEEGEGFTYSRSSARRGPTRGSARTRTSGPRESRSANADQPPVYEPPLSSSEPLNLTLTSQKVHGGFASRGMFSGRTKQRQLRTAELLQKHVLDALPAARLFNDVALSAPEPDRRGNLQVPKNAERVDHVLLCGRRLVLVSAQSVAAATASWDGRSLRAAGRNVTLPNLAAQAKKLETSLTQQLTSAAQPKTFDTDWQQILLAADLDLFHPVVQAQGAGRSGQTPLAAGRAIGHLVNVLAASAKANLVDRHIMAALRSRLAAPEDR